MTAEKGNRVRRGKLNFDKGKSDRNSVRDFRCDTDGERSRVYGGNITSFGRNRGYNYCRACRGGEFGNRLRRVRRQELDRVAKYNRLLRIEEELCGDASYLGGAAFYNLK